MIQEEDDEDWMSTRFNLVLTSKNAQPGFTESTMTFHYPQRLQPLHAIIRQGFRLNDEAFLQQVRNKIEEVKPVMIIIDPFYLTLDASVDLNNSLALSDILREVRRWKDDYHTSVVIVHHWNKSRLELEDRRANHMAGSFVLNAWYESAMHVEPIVENGVISNKVIIERELRSARSPEPIKCQFNINTEGNHFDYQVLDVGDSVSSVGQEIVEHLKRNGETGRTALFQILGHSEAVVKREIDTLKRLKVIEMTGGGTRGNAFMVKLTSYSD
jgi:hypothetical protein